MIRSDAQSSKAPFILPEKEAPESRGVVTVGRKFTAAGAPERLSVEDLLALRRQLDG
jgi:hypothetical protein